MVLCEVGKDSDIKLDPDCPFQYQSVDETSIAAALHPLSTIWRKRRWMSAASGVVRMAG